MKFVPNILSLLRLISSIPIIMLFQLEFSFPQLYFFAVSFTDYFDGYLARKYSTNLILGLLDLIADKIGSISFDLVCIFFFKYLSYSFGNLHCY